MTRLTTTLLITASLISQIAFAGLPPTSTKSQLDTSKSTTFDFQAPFNQFTKPNGTTALIETGNKNLLKDPGFESADPTSVWVISGAGTVGRTSTAANVGSGSYALSYDAAATNGTVTSAAVAIPNGFIGKTLEASCDIKNTSAGLYKIQAYDGTNVLSEQLITTDPTYFVRNTLTFPAPTSGSISIRFLAGTAGEPVFYADDCYLGLARNVGSTQLISEWTSYTPSLTNGTNVSVTKVSWRQVGDSIQIMGYLSVTGAGSGADFAVSLPTGIVMDTGKFNGSANNHVLGSGEWLDNGTGRFVLMPVYASTTIFSFQKQQVGGLQGSDLASGDAISFSIMAPIVGWTAQTTASIDAISKRGSIYFASGSATNTGSVAAFNVAGFGTNTLEGQALAPTTANDLGIRMTGAPAGTYEVQATGRFYVSSAATTGTRTVCNYSLYDGTSTRGDAYAIAPGGLTAESNDGIGSLTGQFVLSSAGTINVVVRGQRVTGNGTCYAEGPVSISIKNVSQPSPAIVLANSVSTDTTNGERVGRARIASGCASVTSQSNDWISSVSSPGTGQCTINFTTGKFSSAPICVCSTVGQRTCRLNAASTTAALTVDMYDGTNPPILVNAPIDIICMGPR